MNDTFEVKVYYEDTDCGGVVYYGRYLGFLERARTEYLERRGVRLADLMKEGFYFVVAHVDINYRSSGRYADILVIETRVEEVRPASVVFKHRITRKGEPGTVLIEASVKLACVGADFRPTRMKDVVAGALKGGAA